MSNLSAPPAVQATPAAPAAPAAPVHQNPSDLLPAGVKMDTRHSADGFFEAHKAANDPSAAPAIPAPAASPAAPAAPAAQPIVAAAAPATVTPAEPPKGSLAAKFMPKAAAASAPPAPAEPPAAGANPEDSVVLDKGYSQAAHDSFKQIKGITAGLRDQLNAARESERQLKAQLEAAKSTTPAPEAAEIERLRAEHKQMSDRLALVDLREHPKFQAEFVMPQQAALAEASALLAANGITGVDVANLLSKPRSELGKAVSELAGKLSDFDRVEFSENIRRAYALNQNAQSALAKSREIYGGLKNQNETQQKSAFNKTWDRSAGPLSEHIVEIDIPADLTDAHARAAAEAYNASIKGLRTVAEQRAFGPATAENVSENAIKSAAYAFHIQQAMPRLMGEFQSLLNLNKQLADQLTAIRGRNPNAQISGAGNGGPTAGGGNPDGTLSMEQLSKMSHADAAAALAPRMRG